MRTSTALARLAVPAAVLLVLSACGGTGDDELASIDLEEGAATADGADEVDGRADPDSDAGATDGDTAVDDSGEAAQDTAEESAQRDGVVDLTEAIPGTWPVGDAGIVTFSIVDGALVLDDVTADDGWMAAIDGQDPDEIEVDFTRDNVEWEIEIELEDDGRVLEIEIDQDIEPADPGSYDIGDAGTFAFSSVDGRLALDDLNVADGWTLVELDEEADEIEFELVNGPRTFDIEMELEDDGTIELEIDYEVTGPVTG